MKLYDYYRSSSSFRVRIALNLKGIDFEQQTVDMWRNGGEQLSEAYRKINPQSLLPTLETDKGVLHQSLAIIEYLNEIYPEPPLLPEDAWLKARVRGFALDIACDIQPLANLRVQKYLEQRLDFSRSRSQAWLSHWISSGLKAMEKKLAGEAKGDFCFGDSPGLADIVLIPQLYNAYRIGIETTPFHRLEEIYNACMSLPAFDKAAPENQPDAEHH